MNQIYVRYVDLLFHTLRKRVMVRFRVHKCLQMGLVSPLISAWNRHFIKSEKNNFVNFGRDFKI